MAHPDEYGPATDNAAGPILGDDAATLTIHPVVAAFAIGTRSIYRK